MEISDKIVKNVKRNVGIGIVGLGAFLISGCETPTVYADYNSKRGRIEYSLIGKRMRDGSTVYELTRDKNLQDRMKGAAAKALPEMRESFNNGTLKDIHYWIKYTDGTDKFIYYDD